MTPNGVDSGQPDVYSNDSPGASVGCLPTTPGPLTSSIWPVAVGDDPVPGQQLDRFGPFVGDRDRVEEEPLVAGRLRAVGGYSDRTLTRTPRVVASDVNMSA